MRNCANGIVLKHARSSAVVAGHLGFERCGGFQARRENGAVCELDTDFWPVATIFINGEGVDNFSHELFAINHQESFLMHAAIEN